MTAHAMVGDREQCLASGMHDQIPKPISGAELKAVIARNSGAAAQREEQAAKAVPDQPQPEAGNSPAPSPQPAPLIDREEMLSRFAGNQDLLQSVAEMFPEESSKVLAAMKQARAANHAGDVQLNAHTLKGMLKMFGASAAADAAFALETAGAAGSIGTDSLVETLCTELDRVLESVSTFKGSRATSE